MHFVIRWLQGNARQQQGLVFDPVRLALLIFLTVAAVIVLLRNVPARRHALVSHQDILDSGVVIVLSLTSFPDPGAMRASLAVRLLNAVKTEGYHSLVI